jgi:hypothetical protein
MDCLSIPEGKSLFYGISDVLREGVAGLLNILIEEFLSLLTYSVVNQLILRLLGRRLTNMRPSQVRIQVDRNPPQSMTVALRDL